MREKNLKLTVSFAVFLALFALVSYLKLTLVGFDTNNIKVMLLLIFAVYLWTARLLPNSQISIGVILLIALLKLDTFSNVLSYTFGNSIFIFILSILLISHAFSKSGLAEKIGEALLRLSAGSAKKTLLCLLATAYLLGMFLTAIAGVSIALPIALGILEKNKMQKGSLFGKASVLGVTYGGLIGGIATPLGTPVNLLMMQYLKDIGGYTLSFLHWAAIGIPLSLFLLAACYLLLALMYQVGVTQLAAVEKEKKPLTKGQKKAMVTFTIILLLFFFSQLLEGAVPILALNLNIISVFCCLMVALPPLGVVDWKTSLKELDWESLIFLVGSVALGYLLYHSGTADKIAGLFFERLGEIPLPAYVFGFCGFTIVMHLLLSSNTVTGTVIIPILLSFAQRMGVSPWFAAAPAMFCVSLAFLLPTESPTNAITYNTGYYELGDMLKAGMLMTLVSLFFVSGYLLLNSLIGLYPMG